MESNRIDTPLCSRIFGKSIFEDGRKESGLVRTSTNLVIGDPAVGKSTLVLQLLSEISTVSDREVLYITAGKSTYNIKRRADRLRIQVAHRVRVVEFTDVSDIAILVAKFEPAAVVIDWLSQLVQHDSDAARKTCRLCKELAVQYRCPFLIVQPTIKKSWATIDIAGHEVDCIVHLHDGVLEVEKNRFGSVYITRRFEITDTGFQWASWWKRWLSAVGNRLSARTDHRPPTSEL